MPQARRAELPLTVPARELGLSQKAIFACKSKYGSILVAEAKPLELEE